MGVANSMTYLSSYAGSKWELFLSVSGDPGGLLDAQLGARNAPFNNLTWESAEETRLRTGVAVGNVFHTEEWLYRTAI